MNNEPFRFGKDIEILASHHQIIRSKSCTPKLFQNPPSHPGLPPDTSDESETKKWEENAATFACYYLIMFRPEKNLYNNTPIPLEKYPRYDWEAYTEFIKELQDNEGKPTQLVINQFRLDQMSKMIQSLKMNTRAKQILSHYRGLPSTKWSEQEQTEARDAYRHNISNNKKRRNRC